jgi:hypothetical protein
MTRPNRSWQRPGRAPSLAVLAVLVGTVACADDDDQQGLADQATPEEFCARLDTSTRAAGLTIGGTIGANPITDTLVVFQQLQQHSPAEIAPDVARVTEQLELLLEASQEGAAAGTQGVTALNTAAELSGVDLTEMQGAADRVAGYAREHCEFVDEENVPPAGEPADGAATGTPG